MKQRESQRSTRLSFHTVEMEALLGASMESKEEVLVDLPTGELMVGECRPGRHEWGNAVQHSTGDEIEPELIARSVRVFGFRQPTLHGIQHSKSLPQGTRAESRLVKQKAIADASRAGRGLLTENEQFVMFQLSDGKCLNVPKYWLDSKGDRFRYASLVDARGRAHWVGTFSPEFDKLLRSFLTQSSDAIRARTLELQALKKRGWLKNSFVLTRDGKYIKALASLQELEVLSGFGVRYLYNLEACDRGRGLVSLTALDSERTESQGECGLLDDLRRICLRAEREQRQELEAHPQRLSRIDVPLDPPSMFS